MKVILRRMRFVLLHVCVVCAIVCVTAGILDWFNPYMDFTGRVQIVQLVLYVSVLASAVTRVCMP